MAILVTFAFFAIFFVFGSFIGYLYGIGRGHAEGYDECEYNRDHAEALVINAEVDAARYRERNNFHAEALKINRWRDRN